MKLILLLCGLMLNQMTFAANVDEDILAIKQAARDYIESQHQAKPKLMARGLHKDLKKRTYWKTGQQPERVLETSYETMLNVAENYNKNKDKFPDNPRVDITILDIDQRVASVKLVADDWIDYMHLYKNDQGKWKIINVLWQYHDIKKHQNK